MSQIKWGAAGKQSPEGVINASLSPSEIITNDVVICEGDVKKTADRLKTMEVRMRFRILRSKDSDGNTDHFVSYVPEGVAARDGFSTEDDAAVGIIEITDDIYIYASAASIHAMRALAEMDPDSEESFAKALEELVHQAFYAGMRYKNQSP